MASRKRGGGKDGSPDEQVTILRAIWNEMKALNARVDKTNERLDKTNERLDAVRMEFKSEPDPLGRRLAESEVRLAMATTQLSGDVQELRGLIREWWQEQVNVRLARLEQHTGIDRGG